MDLTKEITKRMGIVDLTQGLSRVTERFEEVCHDPVIKKRKRFKQNVVHTFCSKKRSEFVASDTRDCRCTIHFP